jgi:hypothetical protein
MFNELQHIPSYPVLLATNVFYSTLRIVITHGRFYADSCKGRGHLEDPGLGEVFMLEWES